MSGVVQSSRELIRQGQTCSRQDLVGEFVEVEGHRTMWHDIKQAARHRTVEGNPNCVYGDSQCSNVEEFVAPEKQNKQKQGGEIRKTKRPKEFLWTSTRWSK